MFLTTFLCKRSVTTRNSLALNRRFSKTRLECYVSCLCHCHPRFLFLRKNSPMPYYNPHFPSDLDLICLTPPPSDALKMLSLVLARAEGAAATVTHNTSPGKQRKHPSESLRAQREKPQQQLQTRSRTQQQVWICH